MPLITDPYDFTNGDPADADQVDARFAPLYGLLNGGIDGDNAPALLQLLVPGDHKIAFGTQLLTLGVFEDDSSALHYNPGHATVGHGLGVTPAIVLCAAIGGGTRFVHDTQISAGATNLDSDSFDAWVNVVAGSDVVGQSVKIAWLAIS